MKNKNKSTKFPVARIKKIMQKDEEVGKVAQATPIVISKALELFLNLIIEESYKVTAERGSKKVEAYHLKHAVETTEMLDFLKEIVEAVPDPSAGGTIDLDAENAETKKRRGKGKRAAAAAAAAAGAPGDPVPKRRRKRKADPEQAEERPAEIEQQEEQDEDAEMNEYDDDNGTPSRSRPPTREDSSEDDGWNGNKPYMPGR